MSSLFPMSTNGLRTSELTMEISLETKEARASSFSSPNFVTRRTVILSDQVLKKISSYVKNIIFSHHGWISRTNILQQIYYLDKESEEFTYSSSVTKSNLKRRVYDSINVLYASEIVERRVEIINFKKEYFFKPKSHIGRLELSR